MPLRTLENGKLEFYEEKSHLHAILCHNYSGEYPKGVDVHDWDTWTLMRSQEIHTKDWLRVSHYYHNITPSSRSRIMRIIAAHLVDRFDPRVNTSIRFSLSFDHYWIKGKG